MSKNGTTHQACASCKHQRKRCEPHKCRLAPFFPPEKSEQFLKVHKVFGVSNVQKLLNSLDTYEERARAIESICWEADWRQREPVEGCWAEYKRQSEELRKVKLQVAELLKLARNNNNNNNNNSNNGYYNINNNNNNNGELFVEPLIGVSYLHGLDEGGQVVCSSPSINSLNQHYYLQDHLTRLQAKAMSDAMCRDDRKGWLGFGNM